MRVVAPQHTEQPAPGRLFALTLPLRRQDGFTLLEIMAVIVIVGIVMTFVALSTGGDRRAEVMEREAHRLMALLELASDEAVVRSEQLALRLGETDYEFMTLAGNDWVAISDDPVLRPRTLPDGIEMRLELQDNPPPGLSAEESDQPQVFLLSSGEMTPFVLTLSADRSEERYHIKASLLGRLELE